MYTFVISILIQIMLSVRWNQLVVNSKNTLQMILNLTLQRMANKKWLIVLPGKWSSSFMGAWFLSAKFAYKNQTSMKLKLFNNFKRDPLCPMSRFNAIMSLVHTSLSLISISAFLCCDLCSLLILLSRALPQSPLTFWLLYFVSLAFFFSMIMGLWVKTGGFNNIFISCCL